MRLFRLAPAMLAPALVAVALTGACGTASAQSRSGIESAPLLPPAGVGTPDYPGYPSGAGTQPQQRVQPAAPAPAQQPYQGIYGIGSQTPGQGQGQPQGQSQPQGQAQQGRTARPPAGAPPAAAPAPAVPVDNDTQVVPPPAEKIVNPTAVYAGLDKITGRITSFEVGMGETVQFGALQVTPRACYTRPPTEPQNTTSFTEVNEITLEGKAKRIFTGWMFASSPGLHGVEHPIYDVWLTDCKATAPATVKPGAQK